MSIDADWLFEHDARLFDSLGQRMDVADLPRWSNPDRPRVRHGNHAAVPADVGLIPDQLVQVFDAQRRDGAQCRCIDVYGDHDDRDELCLNMGLERAISSPLRVVLFRKEETPTIPPRARDVDRHAPHPEEISAREWFDAVNSVQGGTIEDWQREFVAAQATIPDAHFFAIAIGDVVVACGARYDWHSASQIASLYTDVQFRKTGFGRAVLMAAIQESPHRDIIGTIHGSNTPMLNMVDRIGGGVVLDDQRRRYVGAWE